MTRARKALIVVGHAANLEQVPAWQSMIGSMRERGLLHAAPSFMDTLRLSDEELIASPSMIGRPEHKEEIPGGRRSSAMDVDS